MTTIDRRTFLAGAGVAFAYTVGGKLLWLTPAQAHARSLPLTTLTSAEGATLEAFGETLVPGAAAAGMAHYIDRQLGEPVTENKLMIRYLGVEPPFLGFYRTGLEALDTLATTIAGKAFADLADADRKSLVQQISSAQPEGWNGPPSTFFYFALRADAVDVTYGTPEGFARLNLPYMPHIIPSSQRW